MIPHQANIRIIEGYRQETRRRSGELSLPSITMGTRPLIPWHLTRRCAMERIRSGQKVLVEAWAAVSPGAPPCNFETEVQRSAGSDP